MLYQDILGLTLAKNKKENYEVVFDYRSERACHPENTECNNL